VNNVGREEYLYHFGARSNSNVWADEFVIIDDLTLVTSLGYRMTTLWTGTAPLGTDFDDKMALLYKTNKTEPDEPVVFSYDPLSANPYNPNNPTKDMVYSNEPGWRIWAEELSTTVPVRLDVADLNLAEDEYIIGLKVVYGGVTEGFFTGNGWQTQADPHTVKPQANTNVIQVEGQQLITPFGLSGDLMEDWWYSVIATESLKLFNEAGDETVMKGTVVAKIARNNGVLTDNDVDAVETRVMEPFSFPTITNGLVADPTPTRYPDFPFPKTGDNLMLFGVITFALFSGSILIVASRRQKRYNRTT
jgi:hypothetical protein